MYLADFLRILVYRRMHRNSENPGKIRIRNFLYLGWDFENGHYKLLFYSEMWIFFLWFTQILTFSTAQFLTLYMWILKKSSTYILSGYLGYIWVYNNGFCKITVFTYAGPLFSNSTHCAPHTWFFVIFWGQL